MTIELSQGNRTERGQSPKARLEVPPWLLATLATVSALVLWMRPLASSLWLDETGSFWVIKNGLRTAVQRSIDIQGQSPLYYILLRLVSVAVGSSEMALRSLSIVAAAVATWVLWRLVKRLFDAETAGFTAVVFVSIGSVAFAAADARPYALALLASIASTFFLIRWLQQGRRADQVWYVVFSGLTVYIHYLFALTIVVHVVYMLLTARDDPSRRRAYVVMLAVVAILCLPLVPQVLSLARRSKSLSWTGAPVFLGLLGTLGQPLLFLAGGAFLRRIAVRNGMPPGPSFTRNNAVLLVAWASIAPVVTYAAARYSSARIFWPHYFLSAVPAAAVLIAWAVRQIAIPVARIAIAIGLVLVSFVQSSPVHRKEDWRGALRFAASAISHESPVLLYSGYIESQSLASLRQPELKGFLLSPVSYYPIDRAIVLLPRFGTPAAETYLTGLRADLLSQDAFALVSDDKHPYEAFFAPLVAPRLRPRLTHYFGSVWVTVFVTATG